ncbi:bacillithiol biosynthesis deacetylase BshB1 [Alteribacillus sp. HJP-4]|uniref:bacillithiol biosynthesis deacetylase BshB1 n=1 Tax=Alteribacillus sp. HJP-4 TaxID=2775394 RepID=UPI0035CCD330
MTQETLLIFGAHPDDAEIGMGGTIALHAARGDEVFVCSLTKAELSSNGTVADRQEEAEKAGKVLGITSRFQLSFTDRGINVESEAYHDVVSLIRSLKPDAVFSPQKEDRHPDHGDCGELIKQAVFDAGLRNFSSSTAAAHKVNAHYQYIINGMVLPDFFVRISKWQQTKEKSLLCYESQFLNKSGGVSTPLTEGYVEAVRARDRFFGKQAGADYAEGFIKQSVLAFDSIPIRRP